MTSILRTRPLAHRLIVVGTLLSVSPVLLAATAGANPSARQARAGTQVSAATALSDPSGQPMPVGDLAGFRQVFAGNFLKDSAPGQFLADYPSWGAYPSNYNDTSGHGHYEPSNLYVSGGALHLNLKPGANGAQAQGNAPYPVPSTGGDRLYGKYSVRFKADAVPNWHAAWLLWPQSESWPNDGEIDFPEGDLNQNIWGFMHRQGGRSGADQDAYDSGAAFASGGWHTATTTWTPNALTFELDGAVVGRSTANIPHTPMHWVLQTETASTAPTTPADVQVAWATVYDYAPGVGAAPAPAPAPPAPVPPAPVGPGPRVAPAPAPAPAPTPNPTTTTFDDTTGSGPNAVAYSAGWAAENDPGDFRGSDHASYAYGGTATITWSGSQLTLLGAKAPNYGIGTVSTDGGAPAQADFYDPGYVDQQVMYTSPVLARGTHTTTLTVSGNANPRSPGTQVTLDSFRVTGGAPASVPVAAPSPQGAVLPSGTALRTGQFLRSTNGQFTAVVQSDGNLVVYRADGHPLWATGTYGSGEGNFLAMQTDGNLVLYSRTGRPLWATGTVGTGAGDFLPVQNDHNFVLYRANGQALWASGL